MKAKLKVTQTVSGAGKTDTIRRTLQGLGLKGPRSVVKIANTPSFRGAVKKVIHLVKVEEVDA